MHYLASIPSPTQSVWHLGPFPLRAYALCIILGIIVAIWLGTRRFTARGGNPDHVWDVAAWAIVLGIIGGRLYHVITDPELYFEKGRDPAAVFKVWDGGLGIWGAIALGAAGAWIGCRRRHIRFLSFSDSVVPGVIFAQAIGRWGNYFNNELYGGPTGVPWRLEIHDIDVATGHAQPCTFGHIGAQICGYYQPTFLYESIWDVAIGIALILLDRKFRLGRGNVTALYVMGYTAGRGWIEALRTDHANHFLGLRINDWTAIIVFLAGLAWFVTHGGFHAEREPSPYHDVGPPVAADGATGAAVSVGDADDPDVPGHDADEPDGNRSTEEQPAGTRPRGVNADVGGDRADDN